MSGLVGLVVAVAVGLFAPGVYADDAARVTWHVEAGATLGPLALAGEAKLANLAVELHDELCGRWRMLTPATCVALGAPETLADWTPVIAAVRTDLAVLPTALVAIVGGDPPDRVEPLLALVQIVDRVHAGDDARTLLAGLAARYATALHDPTSCTRHPQACSLGMLGLATISLLDHDEHAVRFTAATRALDAGRALAEPEAARLAAAREVIAGKLAALAPGPEPAWDERRLAAIAELLALAPSLRVDGEAERARDLAMLARAIAEAQAGRFEAAIHGLDEVLGAWAIPVPPPLAARGAFLVGLASASETEAARAQLVRAAQHDEEIQSRPSSPLAHRRGSAIHLGGYLGFALGSELVDDARFGGAMHAALFAPIGIELVHFDGPRSYGVFLSPVDLGVLLDFRESTQADFGVETLGTPPNRGALQLVSPGAYGMLSYGPVAIGLGVTATANLRHETIYSTFPSSSRDVDALRFNLIVAVGLPVVTL